LWVSQDEDIALSWLLGLVCMEPWTFLDVTNGTVLWLNSKSLGLDAENKSSE